jgi:hypothetical protein
MIGIQIISVAFALVAIFFSYTNYRRKDFSGRELFFWLLLWVGFLFVSLFPQFVSPYVRHMGFARLMDFVVVIAFLFGFLLLLHNYLVVKRMQNRVEKLVRALALKDIDDK